jgi:hypothetical protein
MSDPVEELQNLIYARFLADPWFADITIVKGEDGINEKDIAELLATSRQRVNGKKGAAVVVDRPFRDVTAPDMPGPEWNIRIPVGCYEHRTTNRGPGGTNKHIEEIISRAAGLTQLFCVEHLGCQVTCATDAVTPVISADKKQLVAELIFQAVITQRPEPKVSAPKVGGTADAVTITAGALYGSTEGASVYYTTDGSYPTPDNGTFYGFVILSEDGKALLSEDGQPLVSTNTPEPFAVAAGTTVLANAWKDGMQHSDLAGKKF